MENLVLVLIIVVVLLLIWKSRRSEHASLAGKLIQQTVKEPRIAPIDPRQQIYAAEQFMDPQAELEKAFQERRFEMATSDYKNRAEPLEVALHGGSATGSL